MTLYAPSKYGTVIDTIYIVLLCTYFLNINLNYLHYYIICNDVRNEIKPC